MIKKYIRELGLMLIGGTMAFAGVGMGALLVGDANAADTGTWQTERFADASDLEEFVSNLDSDCVLETTSMGVSNWILMYACD